VPCVIATAIALPSAPDQKEGECIQGFFTSQPSLKTQQTRYCQLNCIASL
jgi:hypothetical protein